MTARDPPIGDFDPGRHLADFSFPHPVDQLKIVETYLSWIILTGDYAYKIKKPMKLPFVDTTTLQQRRYLCNQELVLNRRLAPELYVGVVPISAQYRIDAGGAPAEYAVRMRQFPPAAELDALLDAGAVSGEEIVDLADRLAEFHSKAPTAAPESTQDHAAQFRAAALGNLATLLDHLHTTAGGTDLPRIVDWIHDTLGAAAPLLRERRLGGFIREGHGDLHARNIVRWRGRLTPFDCIEFNAALRFVDVMDDVAFLVMDLTSRERADLAHRLLDRYLERSGDYRALRLLRLYCVHRALVRAMVDAVSADQAGGTHGSYADRLRRRLAAAVRWIDAAPPTLYLMHGKSGAGKSWLSEQLIGPLQAVRLRSDVERRRAEAAGAIDPADPAGRYSPERIHATYRRLLAGAENCLAGGVNAIVDATFIDVEDRRAFTSLARRLDLPYAIIDCKAADTTMRRRLEARGAMPGNMSDADIGVLERQMRTPDDWDAAETGHVVDADTEDPMIVTRILEELPRSGRGL